MFCVCGRLHWTGSHQAAPGPPTLPGVCTRNSLIDKLGKHISWSLVDTFEQQHLEKYMTWEEHEIRVKDVALSSVLPVTYQVTVGRSFHFSELVMSSRK